MKNSKIMRKAICIIFVPILGVIITFLFTQLFAYVQYLLAEKKNIPHLFYILNEILYKYFPKKISNILNQFFFQPLFVLIGGGLIAGFLIGYVLALNKKEMLSSFFICAILYTFPWWWMKYFHNIFNGIYITIFLYGLLISGWSISQRFTRKRCSKDTHSPS